MGTNTLSTAVDNQIIPAEHHNELVQALLLDLVPRNASRVAATDAGQLGDSLTRWLRLFVNEILVGTTSNNLKIYEGAAGELWAENPNGDSLRIIDGQIQIWTDGVKRFAVTDTGIDWNTQANFTLQARVIANRFWHRTLAVSGSAASVGLPLGAPFNVTLTAGRRYILTINEGTFTPSGSPASVALYDLTDGGGAGGTEIIHIGTGLDTMSTGKEWEYLPASTGTHTFQWMIQRATVVNLMLSFKEA